VTIPLAGALFFGIVAIAVLHGGSNSDAGFEDLFFASCWLVVAIAAGLITTGVLLRNPRHKRVNGV
jgi:hypothetical protein